MYSSPDSRAAMSPATPWRYTPMMAASSGEYPCASKEPIIPVSTSPLPGCRHSGIPGRVEMYGSVGQSYGGIRPFQDDDYIVFRGYVCDTFQSRSIVGHGAEHAFEFVNVRCEYGMGRQIS